MPTKKTAILLLVALSFLLPEVNVCTAVQPTQDEHYSIQFMAVPMAHAKKGRSIYERLKSKGYLVYYFKVSIEGRDWMRLKAGLFPTVTAAKTFGETFKEKEGFDYFVVNADVRVLTGSSGNEVISTPNALWLKDDEGYRELVVFDSKAIGTVAALDRIETSFSADQSEILCLHGANQHRIPLMVKAPPEKEKKEALDADNGDAETYYKRGFAYYKQENLTLAADNFSRALFIDPQYTAAYYYRGIVHYRQGRYDEAVADCTSALELEPRHAGAYNIRALVWLERGELDRAVKDCDAALKIDPQNIAALSTLGVAWLQKGEEEWACSDLRKACDLGRCDTLETVRKQGYCQ